MNYMMNYGNDHGIFAENVEYQIPNDTIHINGYIDLAAFCQQSSINFEDLKKLKEVSAVNQLSALHFQLSTPNAEAVKKQLLQLSIEKNWNIVSLQSQSQSLENVFRELTQAEIIN